MNKSVEQTPILPAEGDYITEIEENEPVRQLTYRMELCSDAKARVKVRVKHKILDYLTPEEGKAIVADVRLREILVCS